MMKGILYIFACLCVRYAETTQIGPDATDEVRWFLCHSLF